MEPSLMAAEVFPEPAAHPSHYSAQKENDVKQKKVNFRYFCFGIIFGNHGHLKRGFSSC